MTEEQVKDIQPGTIMSTPGGLRRFVVLSRRDYNTWTSFALMNLKDPTDVRHLSCFDFEYRKNYEHYKVLVK